MESSAAAAMEYGLGERQRLEQPPFLRLQREDRHEGDGDHQKGIEQRRAHFGCRGGDELPMRRLAAVALDVLVGVLDHDDGRVHHGADGDGDAAQRHDVGVDALLVHDDKRHQNRHRKSDDGDQRTAEMEQKDDADDRDDNALFEQLSTQRFNRALNQLRAVISDLDLHALGQSLLQLGQLRLYVLDHLPGIRAEANHHDAAHGFALAVQFRKSAADLRSVLHGCDVLQEDRRAVPVYTHGRLVEVVEGLDIAQAPDHELLFRDLQQSSPYVVVAALDCHPDFGDGDVVAAQFVRIRL